MSKGQIDGSVLDASLLRDGHSKMLAVAVLMAMGSSRTYRRAGLDFAS